MCEAAAGVRFRHITIKSRIIKVSLPLPKLKRANIFAPELSSFVQVKMNILGNIVRQNGAKT